MSTVFEASWTELKKAEAEIERLRAALELVRDAVEWNDPPRNSVLIRVKMALGE